MGPFTEVGGFHANHFSLSCPFLQVAIEILLKALSCKQTAPKNMFTVLHFRYDAVLIALYYIE